MINRNTGQSEQEHKDKRKLGHKMLRQKGAFFKSKLVQMEIAYNKNEAKEFLSRSEKYKKRIETTKLND